MNTDDRLKALYRQSTSQATDDNIDADLLMQALQRSGWPDEEGTPIDRIANSALHADLLRLVMELGPEAQALSRDVAALRGPSVRQARPSAARGWLALAAGVGAAAVLMLGLFTPHGQESMPVLPAGSESILSASFESAPAETAAEIDEAAPIFRADFDS